MSVGTLVEVTQEQWRLLDRALDKLAKQRVKMGMRMLDERFVADWPRIIQLQYLDLRLSDSCVLGQLGPRLVAHLTGAAPSWDNRYSRAADALFAGHENPDQAVVLHGFVQDELVDYKRLNRWWERAVGKRQRKLAGLTGHRG